MNKGRIVLGAGLAVLLIEPVGVLAAERRFRDIDLRWSPTAQLGEMAWVDLTGLGDRAVELRPFEDQRARRDRIGEYRQDDPEVYPVATGTDVARWVTDGFASTLERVGLRVVERDGGVVVRGAVRNLLLTERGGFEAEVALRVSAESLSGEVLWEGLVLGAHSGPARLDRDRGYSETLSGAVFDAVLRLLQNSEFTAALAAGRRPDEEP